GEQRRLAGVRQARECGVGEQLQVQLERRLLAEQSGLRESRRATSRRGEPLVPATGYAAARRDDACGRRGEVGDQLCVLVEHLRPDRNADLDRLARRAVLQRAAAGLTAAGLELPLRAEGGQVAQIR